MAKLHFACQGRGEHCLYNRTFFTMKTRNPRIWIHLMFLSLQVTNLNMWRILFACNCVFVGLTFSSDFLKILGKISVSFKLQRLLSQQFEKLLGYTEV